MAAGDGVVGLPTRWWYVLAAALGRNVNSGGVGGISYPAVATLQTADFNFNYRTAIYWAGQNTPNVANDMAAINSMVLHQAGSGRFAIKLPTIPSSAPPNDTTYLALCTAIRSTYPNNYIDTPAMLALHGDGSANDNADIANGYTPRSLRAPADTVHLNATGQALSAAQDQAFIQAKGW